MQLLHHQSPQMVKLPSSRNGAAVVELAICMPLLTLLALGAWEYGQIMKASALLSEAARKGCAKASQPAGNSTDAATDAKAVLIDNAYSTNSCTVSILVNGTTTDARLASAGDKISVTVGIPLSDAKTVNTFTFLTPSTTLQRSMVMMKQ